MQRFKKRVCLLTEKLGGELEYGDNDAVSVRFGTKTAHFVAKPYDDSDPFSARSYDVMNCSVDLGDGPRCFALPKTYVFDIVYRLASTHLSSTLRDYQTPSILQLSDYINRENGATDLQSLRERVAADPSLKHAKLGGNVIFIEYYRGVLIIYDDLAWGAINVVDF
jgi:hypothetical protein